MSSPDSYLTFLAGARTFAVAASRVLEVVQYGEVGDIPLIEVASVEGSA